MGNRLKAFLLFCFAAGFAWLLWHLTQGHAVAIMDPKGPLAREERNIILIATALMLCVVLPVFGLTAFISWRYRASNTRAPYTPNWEHSATEEFIWWTIPCIIVAVLAAIALKTSYDLDPFKPLPGQNEVIEVVSLDWKWLFIYPKEGIASVNLVEFPVGVPIEFRVTSDAPMNSFWIPQLSGQIYAMTGMVTQLHLSADEAGDYNGMSANISGNGFSGMQFTARAVSRQAFDQWVSSTKQNPVLDAAQYGYLATPSSYVPVRYYGAVDPTLFDSIVGKYNVGNMNMDH